MRRILLVLVAIFALCAGAVALQAQDAPTDDAAPTDDTAPTGELTADDIVDRALETDTMGFQSGEAVITLIIQDDSGESRERRIQVRAMEEDGSGRALVRVLEPAEVAGQSYLFRENPDGEDEVYVFLPALDDAPRRISGSQKNGSFMGTHLTYADLESRDISDATYTRLDDEAIGTFDCYVIDAVPNNPDESDYASIRMWIRQSDYIPLRTRFFDDDGSELKTMFTEQVDEHDGEPYVRRLTLRPADGGATTMVIESLTTDAGIDASEFTQQNLAN